MLSHMANPRPDEKQLAYFALAQVRLNGGILEHPAGSRLWKEAPLPLGDEVDEFGGFTIEIDQFDFGHVAHKNTKLYICGIAKDKLPPLPPKNLSSTDRSICGNVRGTKRCTQYQREYTPDNLIYWMTNICERMLLKLGKGSGRRPLLIENEQLEKNWDLIFGKKKQSRMDTIGQNGNSGDHYEYELNKSTGEVEKRFRDGFEKPNGEQFGNESNAVES
jgi:hypothetical protein